MNVDERRSERQTKTRIQRPEPVESPNSTDSSVEASPELPGKRVVEDGSDTPRIFTIGSRLAICPSVMVSVLNRAGACTLETVEFERFSAHRASLHDSNGPTLAPQNGFTLSLETHTDALYRENMPIVKRRGERRRIENRARDGSGRDAECEESGVHSQPESTSLVMATGFRVVSISK